MNTSEITGHTRVAAVIGWPIDHSLSPTIHNAGFRSMGVDWTYVALPIPAGGCQPILELCRQGALGGLSVTMPHKTAVFEQCDRLSPAAERLRSVNTVVRGSDGSLVGHSTDGDGLLDSLRAEDVDVTDRTVLVLGWGGAARSVTDALVRHRAGRIVISNRSGVDESERSAIAPDSSSIPWFRRNEVLASVDLVINCTSVGMGSFGEANSENSPIDVADLRSGTVVTDLVYHPLSTPLLQGARSRGCRVVGGLGMLIHQAARQQALWIGSEPDVAAMTDAALRRLDAPR